MYTVTYDSAEMPQKWLSYEELDLNANRIPFDDRRGADVWPDGARLAVIFNVPVEQWRWDREEMNTPVGYTSSVDEKRKRATKLPLLDMKAAADYGTQIGMHRIKEILDEHEIKTTFVCNGVSVERNPEFMSEIVDEGHEICGHAYSQGTPLGVQSRADQEDDILQTIDTIEGVTGERPWGWINPGACATMDTVELMAKHDFLYYSDFKDDELPYFIEVGGRQLAVVPSRKIGHPNDHLLYGRIRYSVPDAIEYLTTSFDAYYREAGKRPLLYRYPAHAHITGHPDAAYVYSKLIEHIQGYEDIWITSYHDVAEWWIDRFGDGYDL